MLESLWSETVTTPSSDVQRAGESLSTAERVTRPIKGPPKGVPIPHTRALQMMLHTLSVARDSINLAPCRRGPWAFPAGPQCITMHGILHSPAGHGNLSTKRSRCRGAMRCPGLELSCFLQHLRRRFPAASTAKCDKAPETGATQPQQLFSLTLLDSQQPAGSNRFSA